LELNVRTAILLVALAFATPASAASYERQSDALKTCFEQGDSGKCMVAAGWKFCPHCATFGTMLGGECMRDKNGPDRPACWYWHEDQEPESAIALLARWQAFAARRGWERQKTAPFAPDDDDSVVAKPVPRMPVPRTYVHEPAFDERFTFKCHNCWRTPWATGGRWIIEP
jgi:hypothetical protein